MTAGLAFWILMLIWLVFGIVSAWKAPTPPGGHWWAAGDLMAFTLFVLLGWSVFGPPIRF